MTESLVQTINDEREGLVAAVSNRVPPELFMQAALGLVTKIPKLKECSSQSFMSAVRECANLGIIPGGNQASIIPYKNKATFILGFGGVISLAYRSGYVTNITAEVVLKNDEFKYSKGDDAKIYHVPNDDTPHDEKNNPITHAYCIIALKEGGKVREVMNRFEIDKVRDVSPAKSSGPWVQWFGEMAKKTVIKRAGKKIPQSPDLTRAYEIDEVPDAFPDKPQDTIREDIIEAEAIDPPKQMTQNIEEKPVEYVYEFDVTKKDVPVSSPSSDDWKKYLPKEDKDVIRDIQIKQIESINQMMALDKVDLDETIDFMQKTFGITEVTKLNEIEANTLTDYLIKACDAF